MKLSILRSFFIPVFLVAIHCQAGDWPRWGGPSNNGRAMNEPELTALPSNPVRLWRVKLGEGFSSPVIQGSRLAIMDHESGREVLHLLDAADGREIWKTDIDEAFQDQQGPPGPRNTPVMDGDRIYVVSCRGEFQCRSLKDGSLLWRVHYVRDFNAEFIGETGTAEGASRHGNNGSPLVDGPHIIAPVGGKEGHGVVCFDKFSGEVVWASQNDTAGYGSPVVANLGNVKQVVAFTVDGVIGLHRQDGRLLWRMPMTTAFGRHVMTPIVWKDLVMAGSHQVGMMGIRVVRDGDGYEAEQAWLTKEAAPNFSQPIRHDQFLFTLGSQRDLLCLDIESGNILWKQPGLFVTSGGKAYGGFLGVGDHVLLLTDAGELNLFGAESQAYRSVSRVQVAGMNWCNPAFSNGVLYVKDGIKSGGNLWAISLR